MFPKKSRWLKRPIGWEDLGKVEKTRTVEGGETIILTAVHALCNTRINIGKGEEGLFQFCPRCLVKIERAIENK